MSFRFSLLFLMPFVFAGCNAEKASTPVSSTNQITAATSLRDLDCDSSTLAGPVDPRVVAEISERFPLPVDFLEHMAAMHGGQPNINLITLRGKTFQVAEFLTLVDRKSKLPGDLRPHFEYANMDERIVKSVTSVMHCDRNFFLEEFVPFAATLTGMSLNRGYVSFFCLDYRMSQDKPAVVLWDAHKATDEYFNWDSLPLDQQFGPDDKYMNVDVESFVYPVAGSYREFVNMLKPASN